MPAISETSGPIGEVEVHGRSFRPLTVAFDADEVSTPRLRCTTAASIARRRTVGRRAVGSFLP